MAEARPSALSAGFSAAYWLCCASVRDRRDRISARLPPVWAWVPTETVRNNRSAWPTRRYRLSSALRDVQTEGDLVGKHAEFGADRIGHFPGHEGERTGQRQADPNAAHDDVDGVRQLIGEGRNTLTAPAHEIEDKANAGAKRRRATPKQNQIQRPCSTITISTKQTAAHSKITLRRRISTPLWLSQSLSCRRIGLSIFRMPRSSRKVAKTAEASRNCRVSWSRRLMTSTVRGD